MLLGKLGERSEESWTCELVVPIRHLHGGVEQPVGTRGPGAQERHRSWDFVNLRAISYAKPWDWMRSPLRWRGGPGQMVHVSSLSGGFWDVGACSLHWP